MGFPKTWTDEQEKILLEKYKSSNVDDLAKELGKSVKAIRKKYNSIKKKVGKIKKKVTIPKGAKPKLVSTSSITVSEAPQKEEAEEMRQRYLDNEPEFSNSLPDKPNEVPISLGQESVAPIDAQEETQANQFDMDWSVLSNSITNIIDGRITKSNLAPLDEAEKAQFNSALTAVLTNRAKLIGQYADVIALGITTFSIFTPRIIELTSRKKDKKKKENESANLDLTGSDKSVSQKPKEKKEEVIDEQVEAQKRFEEMTQKP